MGNTMDMKIIKTTQIEKKEFDINCDNILEICENNQEEAFDILFGLLETFIKKYKIEELEGSKIFSFRNDGKKLFSVIYKLFYCAEMFEELENEDSEEDLKELNEYKLFMNDIQYIIDNIECEIGGQLIDRHYSQWLDVWNELTDHDESEWIGLNKHSSKTITVRLTVCASFPSLSLQL